MVCFLGWEHMKMGLHWNMGPLYLAWVLTSGNHVPREWPKSKASSALYLEVARQRHFCPILWVTHVPFQPTRFKRRGIRFPLLGKLQDHITEEYTGLEILLENTTLELRTSNHVGLCSCWKDWGFESNGVMKGICRAGSQSDSCAKKIPLAAASE